MKLKIIGLTLLCLCLLSGCFLAPAIDAFKQVGVTRGDRVQLLPAEMKKFQDSLYWGHPEEALAFVTQEGRDKIAEDLKSWGEETRVVESKVNGCTFDEDAYKADVEVTVRYYKVPFYVVNKLQEKQVWKFSVSQGWRLDSKTKVSG